MDIVYVIGNSSKYNDLELRISLRSIEKNATKFNRVFIVGEKPKWIQNVIHIPVKDIYSPENNVFNKILIVCKSEISDKFMFMNDDFFMMKKFNPEKYPYFVNGKVEFIFNPSKYQTVLNNTIFYLQEKVDKIMDYRVHCPIVFNRDKFLSLEPIFISRKHKETGYSPRILYGNLFVKKYIEEEDCKIWDDNIFIGKQGCISTKDDGKNILKILYETFYEKSKFEK